MDNVRINYSEIKNKIIKQVEKKKENIKIFYFVDDNLFVQKSIIKENIVLLSGPGIYFKVHKYVIEEDSNNYLHNYLNISPEDNQIPESVYIEFKNKIKSITAKNVFIADKHDPNMERTILKRLVPNKHIDQVLENMENCKNDLNNHICAKPKYTYVRDEKNPKGAFYLIKVELNMTLDTKKQLIKIYQNEILNYILNELQNEEEFIKYEIPLEKLEMYSMNLRDDKVLIATIGIHDNRVFTRKRNRNNKNKSPYPKPNRYK